MSQIFTYSDIGPRKENQDCMGYIQDNNNIIFCIADGVGGNKGGKFISNYVVEKYLNYVNDYSLNDIINRIHIINDEILELQNDEKFSNMATTFTSAVIIDDYLYGYHIGDSRICVLRGNGIKQLTKPHTSASRALYAGIISLEEYKNLNFKNILENAIGKEDLVIETFKFELQKNDRILLSTDGFHDVVSKKEIVNTSISFKHSIEGFKNELINILKSKKLVDNSSFLLFEF